MSQTYDYIDIDDIIYPDAQPDPWRFHLPTSDSAQWQFLSDDGVPIPVPSIEDENKNQNDQHECGPPGDVKAAKRRREAEKDWNLDTDETISDEAREVRTISPAEAQYRKKRRLCEGGGGDNDNGDAIIEDCQPLRYTPNQVTHATPEVLQRSYNPFPTPPPSTTKPPLPTAVGHSPLHSLAVSHSIYPEDICGPCLVTLPSSDTNGAELSTSWPRNLTMDHRYKSCFNPLSFFQGLSVTSAARQIRAQSPAEMDLCD